MELEFLPAKILKKEYQVFGHFYTIELSSGRRLACRSTLEIVNKQLKLEDYASLALKQADAIFIMMNPGSSQPLHGVEKSVSEAEIHELTIELVPAKPDTTQYQVMRIMRHCDWKHVRVLNLSDLREPQSAVFYHGYQQLESQMITVHSVFSESRQNELISKLSRTSSAPIVRAWGGSYKLNPLIDRCISQLEEEVEILGLQIDGTNDKFYHPLPHLQANRKAWVARMVHHLSSRKQTTS